MSLAISRGYLMLSADSIEVSEWEITPSGRDVELNPSNIDSWSYSTDLHVAPCTDRATPPVLLSQPICSRIVSVMFKSPPIMNGRP